MDMEVPVIDMDWVPSGKGTSEQLAVGCSDGSFKLMSKTGRKEVNVADAHNGAITAIKWSYDSAALATAGEDGVIKIWSKGGMLRTTLV